MSELHVPPGHPYSPIPAPADVDRALRASAAAGPGLPGVDLRARAQLAQLRRWQPLYDRLDLGRGRPGRRFSLDNSWFSYGDAVGYALMLMAHRPHRVVEVGAGHSSALALDVAERFLRPSPRFAFIDPDPQRLRELVGSQELTGRLHVLPVQDAPLGLVTGLRRNDILFIDSSHVLKAGSDVQYLLDRVLPRLADGVLIHFHDVFWPFEYPASWLRRGTAMNEAYAVHALLTGGHRYRIELFADHLVRFHAEWFARHMPLFLAGDFPTGGIWLRKEGRVRQVAASAARVPRHARSWLSRRIGRARV